MTFTDVIFTDVAFTYVTYTDVTVTDVTFVIFQEGDPCDGKSGIFAGKARITLSLFQRNGPLYGSHGKLEIMVEFHRWDLTHMPLHTKAVACNHNIYLYQIIICQTRFF